MEWLFDTCLKGGPSPLARDPDYEMPDRLSSIRTTLQSHGQEHLLAFWDELDADRQASLLTQIQEIDFDQLKVLIGTLVVHKQQVERPGDLEPAPFYAHEPGSTYDPVHYREVGEELLRAGKVAAFTVAGGQGTRLGWRGPKGAYPAAVVTGKPLFRLFAEQIRATEERYGATIRWYIMTSPENDAETRAFIQDNRCFGLDRRNIFMFPQGQMPSIEAETGKLLLADKDRVAINPDGHGGSLRALVNSGAIDAMLARDIEYISYFQVDNPSVRVIDPLFIGLHAAAPDSSGEMSSKMVQKVSPDEKVGIFCRIHGKTVVIEYSEPPDELAQQRGDDGRLRFSAGSIAVHMLGAKFVKKLASGEEGYVLPYHRAMKIVSYVDTKSAQLIQPKEANAVKLETLVFDALPLAESSIVLETSRVEEFAPIKNAQGNDSPATSHQLQSDRAGRWLEAHGVSVPRNVDGHVSAQIEISPLTALQASDLTRLDLPDTIEPGQTIVL